MPKHGRDDEQNKKEDLQDQTSQNDVLTAINSVLVVCVDQHGCSGGLHQETKDVADHEDLGEPVDADKGVLLTACSSDQATQEHIDRCREQDGCEQDEEHLDDVRSLAGEMVVRVCSSGESDNLD